MRLRVDVPHDRALGRAEHVAEARDEGEVFLPELRHGDVFVVSRAELNAEDVADEPVDAVHEVNVVRYPRRLVAIQDLAGVDPTHLPGGGGHLGDEEVPQRRPVEPVATVPVKLKRLDAIALGAGGAFADEASVRDA